MKNKLEFILGLIGGILGILLSLFAIFIGFISDLGPIMDSTTGEIPTNTTMILGGISLIASILGIIGSILIKTKLLHKNNIVSRKHIYVFLKYFRFINFDTHFLYAPTLTKKNNRNLFQQIF
ncbi:DUF4064 domain-containing protein [Bacillus tropicus]|uniref:DUF4064 domain-containing protein n=1 Tax=Bacillus tropicus TaxID=2026188 RepID=UPI003D028D5D